MTKSGFYYYGFRFYDPVTQRWINRDPIGEEGGINMHVFVGNDPVDGVDAWGFCEILRQPRLVDDEFGPNSPPLSLWDMLNRPMYDSKGRQVLTEIVKGSVLAIDNGRRPGKK